jgi:hypothetical protein
MKMEKIICFIFFILFNLISCKTEKENELPMLILRFSENKIPVNIIDFWRKKFTICYMEKMEESSIPDSIYYNGKYYRYKTSTKLFPSKYFVNKSVLNSSIETFLKYECIARSITVIHEKDRILITGYISILKYSENRQLFVSYCFNESDYQLYDIKLLNNQEIEQISDSLSVAKIAQKLSKVSKYEVFQSILFDPYFVDYLQKNY